MSSSVLCKGKQMNRHTPRFVWVISKQIRDKYNFNLLIAKAPVREHRRR